MREAVKCHWAFKDKSTKPAPNVQSLPAVGAPPGRHKWEWPLVAGRARFGAWHPRSQQWRRWRCRSKTSQTGKVVFQLVPDAGSHKLWRRIVARYKGIAASPLHHHDGDTLHEKCPPSFVDWISNPCCQMSNSFSSKSAQHCVPLTAQETEHFPDIQARSGSISVH